MDQYIRELLRISAAQICQTIGYNAILTTPLELLQDMLHKFLQEFCRDLRRNVEHYNRTDVNLDDVCLTLNNLSINANELLEYILNVQPVAFVVEVPKFPAHKESNLNFLKPGSKEVLTRPVHIYEHLPPILPPDEDAHGAESCESEEVQSSSTDLFETGKTEDVDVVNIMENNNDPPSTKKSGESKEITDLHIELNDSKKGSMMNFFKAKANYRTLEGEGRPTREIGSVMMTTGGFISPAIEGKLPDARIPDIIALLDGLDAPPPTPPLKSEVPSPTTKSSAPASTSTVAMSTSKIEAQNKPLTTSNLQSEKPSTSADNSSHKHQLANSAEIANASPSVTSESSAMRLGKAHIPFQHSNTPPQLANRILKKAKKKHANLPYSTQSKSVRSMHATSSSNKDSSTPDLNDKAHRKRLKMLQKLVKSAKSSGGEISTCSPSDETAKDGVCSSIAPNLLKPDRLQMEKFLRKQNKHRQKLLKQKLTVKTSAPKRPTPQAVPEIHTPCTSKSASQASSNFAAAGSHYHLGSQTISNSNLEIVPKKHSNSSNLDEKLSPGSASKSSPPLTVSSPVTGYRGIKPGNVTVPVFGEVAFRNEQSGKDITHNISPEFKLSTEPDRSKLNIFKKISSKQKQSSRSLSPALNASVQTQIYSANQNQIINLPSGTTITPAPTASGHHVYAPEDHLFVPDSVRKTNAESSPNKATSSGFLARTPLGPEVHSVDLINKPKKRGRKPGSKNQPKMQGLSTVPPIAKKSKKYKSNKNIYGPPLQLTDDQGAEPLNLSSSFSSGCDMNTTISLGNTSTFNVMDQSNLHRDIKKERKKAKAKDAFVNEAFASVHGMQQHRVSTKRSDDMLFSGPTKEEVDSINKKLLKMDTVLQPAPPINPLSISAQGTTLLPTQEQVSPTKSGSAASKHRSSQQRNQNAGMTLPTSCEGPLPVQNFPNLPPNMLPMLPMYPFAPRPGLIPAPGLFPSVLGNFPNNPSNPAANMLLQGFLPFSGLKPPGSGRLLSPGLKTPEKSENPSTKDASMGDRNYCNVAPLVPDSVKLKLSSPGAGSTSFVSPKHGAFGDRDFPKTPQFKPSPTMSENIRESLQQRLSSLATPESRNRSNKSIPVTPEGISFENFIRSCGSNRSTPNKSIGCSEAYKLISSPEASDNQRTASSIKPSLNVDGPIEVSDDSDDAPGFSNMLATTKCKTPVLQHSYVKPPTLPAPLISSMDELFTPIDSMKPTGLKQFPFSSCTTKESKKLKKNKKSNSASPAASFEACLSTNENVGKLAGGADLIPLSATGIAYSSKSTPTNSLTAPTTLPPVDIGSEDFGATNLLSNLSVIPTLSSDMPDKRKDHKKLKKIKYGKIKKKKDKKEKIKNKEKYLEKIEKRIKEKDPNKHRDKEITKKIKKERKREKQRSVRESSSSPGPAVNSSQSLSSRGFDVNTANLSSVNTFITSTVTANSNSSVVPKLTLKLGNCQSPTPCDDMKRKIAQKSLGGSTLLPTREPSPELARISPLVTRPPKPKSSGVESTSHSVASTGVSSGNIHGTFNAELFGDSSKSNTGGSITSGSVQLTPSSWPSGGTLTASSTLLPQQLLRSPISQRKVEESSVSTSSNDLATSRTTPNTDTSAPIMQEANRPSSYIDAEGNRVWICPACGKVDDGSAMIGCDICDAWYHWVCVGILVAPNDNEDWFCHLCTAKKKGSHSIDKKRKRNKKSKQ